MRRLIVPLASALILSAVAAITLVLVDGEEEAETNYGGAHTVEGDSDPDLPGEWVDLAAIYGGPYGAERPSDNFHVQSDVDYSEQGLPPVGGPHWGAAGCGTDPSEAPDFCGPPPWGIYREPWRAESLVHAMEHGGVVVWYKTADQPVIDVLEAWAKANANHYLIVSPYPDMPAETIAITSWSRRDVFAAVPFGRARLQTFLDAHECRFDPEDICNR
jgi:hypothetical protein